MDDLPRARSASGLAQERPVHYPRCVRDVCARGAKVGRFFFDFLIASALVFPLVFSGCVSRPGSRAVLPGIPPRIFPAGREIRGVWLADPRGADWEKIAAHLAGAHINAIFVKFSTGGVAYYPSRVLPFSGFRRDEVSRCLTAMHRYGIAVHGWHVSLQMKDAPTSEIHRAIAEDRVQRNPSGSELYPSYAGVAILSPSSPLNQALETRAVMELAQLGVDGIHLDHVRFADGDSCYCSNCRAGFEQMVGRRVSWPYEVIQGGALRAEFLAYRQSTVTRLVREIRRELINRGTPWFLSAAVFPDLQNARSERGQDWKSWVDHRDIDLLCPMNYTTDLSKFDRRLRAELAAVRGRVPVAVGIGAYLMSSPGPLLEQIAAIRRARGGGFVIFNYDDKFARFFLPSLR